MAKIFIYNYLFFMQILVDSIISNDGKIELDETELMWSDEKDDVKVNNMVNLINEDHKFCNSMFSGGL